MPNTAKSEHYTLDDLLAQPLDCLEELERVRLANTEPFIVADYLGRLTVDQRRAVLRKLNETLVSDILSEMDADESAEVVGAMRESRAVLVIEHLDPDDAADMMGELNEEERERLLKPR